MSSLGLSGDFSESISLGNASCKASIKTVYLAMNISHLHRVQIKIQSCQHPNQIQVCKYTTYVLSLYM